MSKVSEIETYVDSLMERNKDGFRDQAIYVINNLRAEKPSDADMEMAIQGEIRAIRFNMVKERTIEAFTTMFRETIEQANSSFDAYFVEGMVAALFTTHKTIQSEFWLNMFKVMEAVAKADDRNFDGRNAWTKQVLDRMIFAHINSAEVDALRSLSPEAMYKFRSEHGCNAR